MQTPTSIHGQAFNQPTLGQGSQGQSAQRSINLAGTQGTVVTSELSKLLDAAEEMGAFLSEKAEDLEHDQREIKSPAPAQVMQIQQINEYLDAARMLDDPTKLQQLAQRMLQPGQQTPQQLARQHARDHDDPTQQYVLLQFALQHGQANGAAEEALDNLVEAIEELETFRGPQIRAGLNTIVAAGAWAESGEDISRFQQTYRDVALGNLPLSQTLKVVLERLSGAAGEKLIGGLNALINALGSDMSATHPSTDAVRLQTLRSDLYQLSVMKTVLEGCQALAAAMHNTRSGVQ